MVALGIVLIVVGLLALLAALFVSEGTAELLGMDLSALAIFLVGFAAGACLLWGFAILKWGTRRSLAARQERKELRRLGDRLDRAQGDEETDHGQRR